MTVLFNKISQWDAAGWTIALPCSNIFPSRTLPRSRESLSLSGTPAFSVPIQGLTLLANY